MSVIYKEMDVHDHLYQIRDTLRDADDVWRASQRLWYTITPKILRRYYISLPRRMALVIRSNGDRIIPHYF